MAADQAGMTTRWVGIDEAGYGPNLGPFVMTAVVAEGDGDGAGGRPDLWNDRADTVCRAGGHPRLLWVDDSKRLHHTSAGRERLEAATLAVLAECGQHDTTPATLCDLLRHVAAGSLESVELGPWLAAGHDPPLRIVSNNSRPLRGARWKISTVRAVVLGPAVFNARLDQTGSKAEVHASAFAELLDWLWWREPFEHATHVVSDKHGGRHFYLKTLTAAVPDAWIDRHDEGPSRSEYTLRDGVRRLQVTFQPRADADDGLVALASIVSKTLRECWMDVFNGYWMNRIPGLKPTAGYPVDAARFRAAIEPHCALPIEQWWRRR